MTRAVSMSAALLVVPMVSKSHCQNSRNRPCPVFSPRQTGPMCVALERRAELADVLGREAGEGHGQVEAQGHVAVAMIAEAVDELVGFVAALADAGFRVYSRAGVSMGAKP